MDEWGRTSSGLWVPNPAACKKYYAVDLFAGCGGFSLGVEAAGMDVVAAVEWDATALMTYLWNLGHPRGCAVGYTEQSFKDKLEAEFRKCAKKRSHPFEVVPGDKGWIGFQRLLNQGDVDLGCRAAIMGDATEVTGESILEALEASGWRGKIDCVIGGPPCQGISTANTKASPHDPRNNLLFEFIRITHELDADCFMMENVAPLIEGKKFKELRDNFLKKANEYGYDVAADIVCASNYGVPQKRRRALFFGSKSGRIRKPFNFPIPSHWNLVSKASPSKEKEEQKEEIPKVKVSKPSVKPAKKAPPPAPLESLFEE